MTLTEWHEEPISKSHDRKRFDCGDADLNAFLQKYARQNHESGVAKTLCAISDTDPACILGFYSLAPTSVEHERLSPVVRSGLPRHDVGGFLLARVAIDKARQGQGLGGQLLLAAGKRCLRAADVSRGVIMVIDAKNERAADWYQSYGAARLEDAPLKLVLPLQTVLAVLEAAAKL